MRWFSRSKPNRVRFRAMMESGLLIDEEADIVQTQVIAHKARASIRNRNTVPLYHQTEEGRSPVWKENLLVETGLSPLPGMDSRYNLQDSLNLFVGIRSGAVEVEGDSPLKSNGFAIIANVGAVIVFLACAWLAGLSSQVDPAASVTEQVEGRVSHETVDTITGEVGTDAGQEGQETGVEEGGGESGEGPGGPDTGAEEPVVPGSGVDPASPVH